MRIKLSVLSFLFMILVSGSLQAGILLDAKRDLKLGAGGSDTEALQSALNAGKCSIAFPGGTYKLGTLELPTNTRLVFAPEAQIKVDTAKLKRVKTGKGPEITPFFLLKGDNISIEGLHAAGVFKAADSEGNLFVSHLAFGVSHKQLRFLKLDIDFPPQSDKTPIWEIKDKVPYGILLENCFDIVFADSRIRGINHGLQTEFCSNVIVRNNVGFNSSTIVNFSRGSRGLKYYGNWSRKMRYPCIFSGGLPDPSQKATIPQGSSAVALRNLKYENRDLAGVRKALIDAGEKKVVTDEKSDLYHIFGVFDIQITNNYAEYGRTLAWGNRARQVIFANNISRFMTDYSYGVEGCENVVFANNISINARSYSIMTMYWTNKVMVTNNLCIVRNEPYEQKYSDFPEQSAYWGGLLRFHHGPTSKSDKAAGSLYGAGNVMVSGNQFINELDDRVRGAVIDEDERDFTISGNRFVNANISKKKGGGIIKVLGNDFTSSMALPHPIISFKSGELICRNNTIRYTGAGSAKTAATETSKKYDTQDEAQGPDASEKLKKALPAIVAGGRWLNPVTVTLENNLIEGWNDISVSVGSGSRPAPCRTLIRNNTISGKIVLTGSNKDFNSHVDGNIDPVTFQKTKFEQKNYGPAKKK